MRVGEEKWQLPQGDSGPRDVFFSLLPNRSYLQVWGVVRGVRNGLVLTLLPRLVPVFRKLPVSSRICKAEAGGR